MINLYKLFIIKLINLLNLIQQSQGFIQGTSSLKLRQQHQKMASKYQSMVSLYLKHTPHHSKKVVEANFQKAQIQTRKQTDRMFYMMERYMTSLQTHREYLEFFQIGVVRDNKRKIQNVAKYVGLAIPGIDSHLRGDQNKISNKNTQANIEQKNGQQNNKSAN